MNHKDTLGTCGITTTVPSTKTCLYFMGHTVMNNNAINSLPPEKYGSYSENVIFKHMLWTNFMCTLVEALPWEYHRTPLIEIRQLFRSWQGAVKYPAIIWDNVDQNLCHHMALLSHNEVSLMHPHHISRPFTMISWSHTKHPQLTLFTLWPVIGATISTIVVYYP